MTYQEASDFLVSLAQNDYTIDGKMLPNGKTLLDIAMSIAYLEGGSSFDWRDHIDGPNAGDEHY